VISCDVLLMKVFILVFLANDGFFRSEVIVWFGSCLIALLEPLP